MMLVHFIHTGGEGRGKREKEKGKEKEKKRIKGRGREGERRGKERTESWGTPRMKCCLVRRFREQSARSQE